MIVPPPSAARATWSAKCAKSAERIDGASSIKGQGLGRSGELLGRILPRPIDWAESTLRGGIALKPAKFLTRFHMLLSIRRTHARAPATWLHALCSGFLRNVGRQ